MVISLSFASMSSIAVREGEFSAEFCKTAVKRARKFFSDIDSNLLVSLYQNALEDTPDGSLQPLQF